MLSIIRKILKEAVVQPIDIRPALDALMKAGHITSIEQLESFFDDNVKFVTIDQYLQMHPGSSFPKVPPNQPLFGGSITEGVIYVFCNPPVLFQYLNSPARKQVVSFIGTTIRHESIHAGQMERSGGKMKDYDQLADASPESMKPYLSNKQEIMAYAQTIIDTLSVHHDYDAILSRLKVKNGLYDQMFQRYQGLFKDDPKVMNLLRKYMYKYLTSGQAPLDNPPNSHKWDPQTRSYK